MDRFAHSLTVISLLFLSGCSFIIEGQPSRNGEHDPAPNMPTHTPVDPCASCAELRTNPATPTVMPVGSPVSIVTEPSTPRSLPSATIDVTQTPIAPARTGDPPDQTSELKIDRIEISNLRDTAAVITWQTSETATGIADIHGRGSFLTTVKDVRGAGYQGLSHYLQITGLQPDSQYDVEISSTANGATSSHQLSFHTGPTLPLPPSETVYGQIFMSEGNRPAEGVVIFIRIADQDRQGSQGESALMSSLVDENGYWHANLGNARTEDLSGPFRYSSFCDVLEITILFEDGWIEGRQLAIASASPADPIYIR